MLFNSYIFLFLFLPLTLVGYYICNHFRAYRLATLWLTGMSLWFYGYHHPVYLVLLVGSIFLNYGITGVMHRMEKRGKSQKVRIVLLISGILVNLGLLFYFKYYDFFIENWNSIFRADYTLMHLMLPLGISFFTFQQLSYVIDCYEGKAPKYDLLYYAAYVTFFPQLIAGPIVLHSELIPQFQDLEKRKINYDNLTKGLYAFSLGLGKKVLLADTFSKFVNFGFAEYANLDGTNVLLAMVCYTLQIYFDFSGYCDMAYGIGYLFNVELPINFHSPYKAESIADFWDRWHMTLTRFFTHYVYIPLGGSRKGKIRTYVNVMVVFLISGFWHGANWTFVLWGVLNGACVVLHRILGKFFTWIPKALRIGGTFFLTTIAWCLFRADTIATAEDMIWKMFTGGVGRIQSGYYEIMNDLVESSILYRLGLGKIMEQIPEALLLVFVTACMLGVFFMKNTQEKVKNFVPTNRKWLVFLGLMMWSILSLSDISEFLYFNF